MAGRYMSEWDRYMYESEKEELEKRKKAAYLCLSLPGCDAVDGKDAEKKLQEKIGPVIGKMPNWEMSFIHDNGYFFSIPKLDFDYLTESGAKAEHYKLKLQDEKQLHEKTQEKLRAAEENLAEVLKIHEAANEVENRRLEESERRRLGTEIQRQEGLKEPSRESTPNIDAPPQTRPRIQGLAAHTADELTSSIWEPDSPPYGSEDIAAELVEARGGNTMLSISSANTTSMPMAHGLTARKQFETILHSREPPHEKMNRLLEGSHAPGESLIRSQGPSIGSLTCRQAEDNAEDPLVIRQRSRELLDKNRRGRVQEPSQETTPRKNVWGPCIGGLAAPGAMEALLRSYGGEETQRVERDSPPYGSEGIAAKVVEARGGNTMLPISSAGSQPPEESLIRSRRLSIGSLTHGQAEDPLVIRQNSRELLDQHRRGRVRATSSSPLKYGFDIYGDGSIGPRRSQISSENASPQSSNRVFESPRANSSNADGFSALPSPTRGKPRPVDPRSRFNDYPMTPKNTPPVDGPRGSQASGTGQNCFREKPRASESGDMRALIQASSSSSRAPTFAYEGNMSPEAIARYKRYYYEMAKAGLRQPSPSISSHQALLRGRSANRRAAKDNGVAEPGRQVPYISR